MAEREERLNYSVVVSADTTQFVQDITDAKKKVDNDLSTVNMKGLADGNSATSGFLNETRQMINGLDQGAFTEARVSSIDAGLQSVYKSFAVSMANAATAFSKSATKINKILSMGGELDQRQYNAMISSASMVHEYSARMKAIETLSRSKSDTALVKGIGGASELAYITRNVMDIIHKDTKSTHSASDMLKLLYQNEAYRTAIGGANVSDQNALKLARYGMALAGPQYYIKDESLSRAIVGKMFKTSPKRYSTLDDVNVAYQDAFKNRGRYEGTLSNENDAVDARFYQGLRKLISDGNQTALSMARTSRLANVIHGEVQFLNDPRMKQLQDFVGILYERMHDVKLGSPMYPKNVQDSTRVNSEMKDLYGVQDLIDEYNRVVLGGQDIIQPKVQSNNERKKVQQTQTVTVTDQNGQKIDKIISNYTPTGLVVTKPKRMESFVIPRVQYNKEGEFDYIDQEDYAMPKGVRRAAWEVNASDKSMMYNYSQLAAALGIKRRGIQDTFAVKGQNGTYRDDEGNPYFGDPLIIAANAEGIYNDATGRIPQNKTDKEIVEGSREAQIRAYNIEHGIRYGKAGKKYVIASAGKNTDYWIQEDYANEVNESRKSWGLKPIFGPEAKDYLINEEELEKTVKAISNTKRTNSEVISRADMGYNATMNLGTLSASAGYIAQQIMMGVDPKDIEKKGNIIDGSGIVDPSSSTESFQLRMGFDTVKGVLARLDLAKQMIMAYGTSGTPEKLLEQGYSELLKIAGEGSGTTVENGKNQLYTKGRYKDAKGNNKDYLTGVWMPSIAFDALSEERQTEILTKMAAGEYTADEAAELRLKYMTNILNTRGRHKKDITAAAKYDSKIYGYEGFLTSEMYKGNYKPQDGMDLEDYITMMAKSAGRDISDQAVRDQIKSSIDFSDTERYRDGKVFLYTKELETYNKALQESAGKGRGAWVMRTTPQFESETYRLPMSVRKSMVVDQSVLDESEALYAERLAQLRDPNYIMRHGLGNYQFDRALDEDPNYIWTETAQSIIQSEINGLLSDKANQTLLMKMPSYTSLVGPKPTEWIKNYLAIFNREIAPTNPLSKLLGGGIYARGFESTKSITGRNPAVLGTYLPLENIAYTDNNGNIEEDKVLASLMDSMGYDKEMIGMSIADLYAMNTGDFDGDTVTMYAHLGAHFEDVFKNTGEANKRIEEAKEKLEKTGERLIKKYEKEAKSKNKRKPTGDLGHDINMATLYSQKATGTMGTAYGVITKALEYNGDSDDVYDYVQAAAEYYDLATSEMQTQGMDVRMPAFLQSLAMDRRLYTRFLKDVSTDITGKETEGTSIFKHGFRSLNSGHSLMDMLAHGTARRGGFDSGDITRQIRQYAANKYIGGSDAIRDAATYIAEVQAGMYTGENLFNLSDVQKTLKTYYDAAMGQRPEGEGTLIAQKEHDLEMSAIQSLIDDLSKNGKRYAFRDVMLDELITKGKTIKVKGKRGNNNLLSDKQIGILENYKLTGERTDEVNKIFEEIGQYDKSRGVDSRTGLIAKILGNENTNAQDATREVLDESYNEVLQRARNEYLMQQQILQEHNAEEFRNLLNWSRRSYSFTNIESYMGNEKNSYQMPYLNGLDVTDLVTGKTKPNLTNIRRDFWNENAQVQREAEELLGVSTIRADAPFGSLMHLAFSRVAEKLANGNQSYTDGMYKKVLMDEILPDLMREYNADPTGKNAKDEEYRKILSDFDTARKNAELESPGSGVTFKDFYDYAKTQTNGEKFTNIISSDNTNMKKKMDNLFGINNGGASFGDLLLKSLGFDTNSARIIMTERKLMDDTTENPTGKLVDLWSSRKEKGVDLPEGKRATPRPDLIFATKDADGNEVFNVVDFKSKYTGAIQSIYQSYGYIHELEELSQKAWEGKDNVDSIYKIFGSLDASGNFISKFKGGKVIGADLLGQQTIAHGFEDAMDIAVWDLIKEAVSRKVKADSTNERGLQEIFNPDTIIGKRARELVQGSQISLEAARMAEERKKAAGITAEDQKGNLDTQEYQEWLKQHDYLLGKFEEDRLKASELAKGIASEENKYHGVGKRTYNKFAKYQNDITALMNSEAAAAFEEEYAKYGYIMKDKAKFDKDRNTAQSALDELINIAIEEDPKRAMDKLALIKSGGKESTLRQSISQIHGIVNNAVSAREALTNSQWGLLAERDEFGKLNWHTKNNMLDEKGRRIDEPNPESDPEAYKEWQQRFIQESLRVDAAKKNEVRYNEQDSVIAALETNRSEMITWAYEQNAADFTSEVEKLIHAPKTVEERIASFYQQEREAIKNKIIEATIRIEDLASQLKVKRGANGEILRNADGSFQYDTLNGIPITGIEDAKEREAAEKNLAAHLAARGKLESFDNTQQERESKEAQRALYDVQQSRSYNQAMVSERMSRWNRYGIGRTAIGRGLSAYYSERARQEGDLYNIRNAIVQKQAERQKVPEGSEDYVNLTNQINHLNKAAKGAETDVGGLGKAMAVGNAVAGQMAQSFGRLSSMFGRRIFMRLITDVKQFVKQFNHTMTEIQMITLKTDSEMSNIGSGLIEKAKELKISINEITQSAATLYRQGLSDEEVESRLETISKFSKVSGTKVADATKLITVAMNTGLVTDPEIASDIVTALGDNAATNAQQIEKGIEKAGAAAAADGTTFAQLASMLTAITSTTQIGGNVAGRTLNTIFGRMNKIGTSELIVDENGNMISGSAVATLLKSQGINQYDTNGNKRSSYDVLYELSQKWEGMTDAEQQQIANAIAGTRQYSNFAAIMQGMSEGKVDEYMKLAGESSGITDKKYEIYTKSLDASLTDLKNTWQSVIAELVDKGYVQDFIDGITTMVRGVGELVEKLGGLKAALPFVMTLVGALNGAKYGLIGMDVGALAGLGTYGLLTSLGEQSKTANEKYNEQIKTNAKKYESIQQNIETVNNLKNKTRTEEENSQYGKALTELSMYAGIDNNKLSELMKTTSDSAEDLAGSILNLGNASSEAADKILEEVDAETDKRKGLDLYTGLSEFSSKVVEDVAKSNKEYSESGFHVTDRLFFDKLWNYNEDTKQYELSPDFSSYQFETFDDMKKAKNLLAELFSFVANTSEFHQDETIPDKYKTIDKKKWNDLFYVSATGTVEIPDEIRNKLLNSATDYINSVIPYEETGKEHQKRTLGNSFSSLISEYVDADMVPYITDWMINQLYSSIGDEGITSELVNKVLNDTLGFDGRPESFSVKAIQKHLKDLAVNKANYVSRQTEFEKYDLEDVGASGYYFDKNSGQFISADEALAQERSFNAKKETDTNVQQVKDAITNEILAEFNSQEYGSIEKANKAAEEYGNTQYQFTDSNGEVHYTDERGNQLTSEAAANLAATVWRSKNGQWSRTVKYYKRTGDQQWQLEPETKVFTGTNAIDVSKQATAFYNEQLANAYGFLHKDGTVSDLNYGSEEDVQQAIEAHNAAEMRRYQEDLARAEIKQAQESSSSYTDYITGETHEATGRLGRILLKSQYLARYNELKDKYFLRDEDGNILGTYDTEEDAEKARYVNPRYWDEVAGQWVNGTVEEGTQNVHLRIGHGLNVKKLGFGETAQAFLNRFGSAGSLKRYQDENGTFHYGKQEDLEDAFLTSALQEAERKTAEAKEKADKYYADNNIEAIERADRRIKSGSWLEGDIELRYGDLDFSREDEIDSMLSEADRLYEEYEDLKFQTDKILQTFNSRIEDVSIELSDIVTDIDDIGYVSGFDKNMLSEFKDHIADLDNVTPADIVEIFGQLPELLSLSTDDLLKYGQTVYEVVSAVKETLSKDVRPNLQGFEDYFLSGAQTSYVGWQQDKKNSYAINADAMIGIMRDAQNADYSQYNVLNEQYSDLQKLLWYVDLNKVQGWRSLYDNGEFGRIMSQITRDEAGNITSAPDDIMEQIENFLYANGRDYGAKQVSMHDKATKAMAAFRGLTDEENPWYVSYEARNRALQKEYDENVYNPWKERRDTYLESLRQNGVSVSDKDLKRIFPLQSIDEYALNKFSDEHYLSSYDEAYLKEILGEELAGKVKKKDASPYELEYANTLLTNAQGGIQGLTAKDKLAGIKRMQGLSQEEFTDLWQNSQSTALAWANGFANFGRYASLKTKTSLNDKDKAELADLEKQFEEFAKNSQIDVDIEGLQTLEQAGELLQGTVDNIKALKKGGKVALEVMYKVQSNAFNSSQNYAKLTNGTRQEQDEAIMSYMGISREQLYATDTSRATYYSDALNGMNLDREREIESIWQEYLKADPNQKVAFVRAAKTLGYNIGRSGYSRIEGYEPKVVRDDYWGDRQELYTGTQIADWQKEVIDRTLTADNTERAGEYKAASEKLGEQGIEYLRMLGTGAYSPEDPELTAQYQKAMLEIENNRIKAVDEDELKNAELYSNSLTGAFGYQSIQYAQQNKTALAADEIFKSLAEIDPSSSDAFSELINSVNNTQTDNWIKLLNSSPDLTKKLEDLGVKIDGDTLDFSALKDSSIGTADVLTMLMQAAAEAAGALNGFKEVLSVGQTFESAMSYLNGEQMADTEQGLESLNAIFGNAELAQIVANNREIAGLNDGNYIDENGYIRDANGRFMPQYGEDNEILTDDNGRIINAKYDKYAGLSSYNREYAETLEENAKYGISGLTDVQRLEQLQRIVNAAQNGGLADLREEDKIGQFADITSGIEGFNKWERAVEAIQGYELSLEDFTADSEAFKDAIESTGISVEDFADINKDLNKQLTSEARNAMKSYGKETEKVMNTYKKLTGTVEEQMDVQTQIEKNKLDLSNATYYTSGKGSRNYKKVAEEFLKYDSNQIKALEKMYGKEGAKVKIEQEAELQLNLNQQEVENDVNAQLQALLDTLGPDINLDDIMLSIGGTYDISKLSELASNLEGDAKQIIEGVIRYLQGLTGEVTFEGVADVNGSTGSIKIKTNNLKAAGGGHKTGSGGGGGQSATEKLITAANHYITEKKHYVTMAQLTQEHYNNTNEYQNQLGAIEQEMVAQSNLLAQYQTNLETFEAKRNTLKKYTDDWWALTEAINSTEEAILETKNAMEKLAEKEIAVVQEKQGHENDIVSHTRTMVENYASKWATEYSSGFRYNTEAAYQTAVVGNLTEQAAIQMAIEQNKIQLEEWNDLLATVEAYSDQYYSILSEITSIEEENASLENELLQKQIDLYDQQLSKIASDLTHATERSTHTINMSDTRGQLYNLLQDYGGYRQELAKQNAAYSSQRAPYEQAIAAIEDQMSLLEVGSAAWYNAREALFEYEEALEQVSLKIEETNQAIEESYLTEVSEQIQKRATADSYRIAALQEATRTANLNGDKSAYIRGLSAEQTQLYRELENKQTGLKQLEDLRDSGKIRRGTKAWDELLNKIKEIENETKKLQNDALEKELEIVQARIDRLTDNYTRRTDGTVHAIDLLKAQENDYKTNGELTNYGTVLNAERTQQNKLLREQRRLRSNLYKELERYDPGTEQYKKVMEEIRKVEKEIASTTSTITGLNKSIKENAEAIRQQRISLEKQLEAEMKRRVQEQKEMLSAAVSMQRQIIEAEKKRYQESWNLQKKDLAKQREALEKEKNLIQERMNARKEAQNQEDKHAKLANLQRQLAVLEADSTRTKEAAQLRSQIEDLQKELANDLADRLATEEQNRLNDIIKGSNDYETNREEEMNEFFKDNNNFMDVINKATKSFDSLSKFFSGTSSFRNMTPEEQEQFMQSLQENWDKMKGNITTYWKEINALIESGSSREDIIAYFKQGSEYQSKSKAGRQSFIYTLEALIDNYLNGQKINEEAGQVFGESTINTADAVTSFLKDNRLMADVTLAQADSAKLSAIANAVTGTKAYSAGGLVDYTGLAAVHGSATKPEAFLSSADTSLLRTFLNTFDHVAVRNFVTPSSDMMTGNTTVGDINITINQAEINNDADIESLAQKIGKAFTKQLSKNGINTASYAF